MARRRTLDLRSLLALGTIGFALLGSGCGQGPAGGSSASGALVRQQAALKAVQGTWSSACYAPPTGTSYQINVTFAQDHFFAAVYQSNHDTHCAQVDALVSLDASVIVGDAIKVTDLARNTQVDAYKANFSFSSVLQRPLSTVEALRRNTMALCGFQDWAGNEAKQTLGLDTGNCPDALSKAALFSVLRLDGNKLYMGATASDRDGYSEDTRMTSIDSSFALIRQ